MSHIQATEYKCNVLGFSPSGPESPVYHASSECKDKLKSKQSESGANPRPEGLMPAAISIASHKAWGFMWNAKTYDTRCFSLPSWHLRTPDILSNLIKLKMHTVGQGLKRKVS